MKHIELLNEYIDNEIDIIHDMKQIIFDDNFYSNGGHFALSGLFSDVFNIKDEKFLNDISIAVYFYMDYLLVIDSLCDHDFDKGNLKHTRVLNSYISHYHTLKILNKYVSLEDPFWKLWEKNMSEFIYAVELDKQESKEFTIEDYILLSKYKCTFHKSILDIFNSYTNYEYANEYNQLIACIEFLGIVECIIDDSRDFKSDFTDKRKNIILLFLDEYAKKENLELSTISINKLEKYCYVSGSTERALSLSEEYLKKILEIINKIRGTRKLNFFIQSIISKVKGKRLIIKAFIISEQAKFLISSDKDVHKSNEISIDKARNFIQKFQYSEGCWYEITNRAGLSNVWATGFIAMNLPEKNKNYRNAVKFLKRNLQQQLWGYNDDWVFDLDSTNCVLITLINESNSDFLKDKLNYFLSLQNEDGGFSTYSKYNLSLLPLVGKNEIGNWFDSHVCVSALTFYSFSLANKQGYYIPEQSITKLENFLISSIGEDNLLKPYWWTSKVYPTTFFIRGLINFDDDKYENIIHKLIERLISLQNNDGSFSCDILNEKSVFYSSMVLETLCSRDDLLEMYHNQIDLSKTWIVEQQYKDGSFKSPNFLLVPDYNVKDSYSVSTWKNSVLAASNAITGEFSNLFSTSVTLSALDKYEKTKNNVLHFADHQ